MERYIEGLANGVQGTSGKMLFFKLAFKLKVST